MTAPTPVDHVVARVERTWSAVLGDEQVLFDAHRGLAHRLSREAGLVWDRCDGRTPVGAIAAELAVEAGAPLDVVDADVRRVVELLRTGGALVDADGTDAGSAAGSRDELSVGSARAPTGADPAAGTPRLTEAELRERSTCVPTASYAGLGVAFTVQVEHDQLRRAVESVLAPLASTGPGVALTVVEVAGRAGWHQVYVDGAHLRTLEPDDDAVGLLLWFVYQQIAHRTALLMVHAGAVERAGRVIVIPGPSGAGKTTLTTALVADGFGYVTEEAVGLDLATAAVVPFPRSLCIETGSQALLPELAAATDHQTVDGAWYVDPERVRAGSRSCGGSVGLVIEPRVETGAELRVEALGAADVLVVLLAESVNLGRIGRGGFDLLVELARSVPGYRITYGDLADARHAIGRLVADPGAGHRS